MNPNKNHSQSIEMSDLLSKIDQEMSKIPLDVKRKPVDPNAPVKRGRGRPRKVVKEDLRKWSELTEEEQEERIRASQSAAEKALLVRDVRRALEGNGLAKTQDTLKLARQIVKKAEKERLAQSAAPSMAPTPAPPSMAPTPAPPTEADLESDIWNDVEQYLPPKPEPVKLKPEPVKQKETPRQQLGLEQPINKGFTPVQPQVPSFSSSCRKLNLFGGNSYNANPF